MRCLSLKFSCEEIIKTIDLTLQCDMFGVTIVLFLLLLIGENVQKKANELIRKQEICKQMS